MSKLARRATVLAALGAGVAAALLAYLLLSRETSRAAERTPPVAVVVAVQEIPPRTVIDPTMVTETRQPVGTLPENCASSLREVVGKVTVRALAEDEPVQREAIAAQTASLGLSYVVPEGMRAVTVAVDSISGVAGFLKAGDHVDVVATFDVSLYDNSRPATTKTVLQDVELIAIGSDVRPEDVGKPRSGRDAKPKEQPNATLAVTPEDAEKLILAESKGKLRLTLRRSGDDIRVALAGARSDALVGAARSVAAPARAAKSAPPAVSYMPPWMLGGPARTAASSPAAKPRKSADTVETIRGSQRSTVEVRPD